MTYNSDLERQAMYITYVVCELGFVIAPYMLSFVEPNPDAGFYLETEGVWRLNYPAKIGRCQISITPGLSETYGPNATFDEVMISSLLDDYLDCVASGTAATCATALVVCGASGPAYPTCVAAGCAAGFVGSLIGCAFSVLG